MTSPVLVPSKVHSTLMYMMEHLVEWLLFSIKSSDYCAATVAKLSLYSTCTWSAVSFGSVKK